MDLSHVLVRVNYLSWPGRKGQLCSQPLWNWLWKHQFASWLACFVEVVQSSRCSIDIQIDYFNYQNQFFRIEWNIRKCISKGHLKLAQMTQEFLHSEEHLAAHGTLSLSCVFTYMNSVAQSTQLEFGKTTIKLHCSLFSHESLNKLTWYNF